jgi:hypothetical protein
MHMYVCVWICLYLNVFAETAMGTRIDAQSGENVEYVNAVAKINQLVWLYERLPWMWVKPIWYLTGNGYEFDRLVKLTTDFTRKVGTEIPEGLSSKNISRQQSNHSFVIFLVRHLILNSQKLSQLTKQNCEWILDSVDCRLLLRSSKIWL